MNNKPYSNPHTFFYNIYSNNNKNNNPYSSPHDTFYNIYNNNNKNNYAPIRRKRPSPQSRRNARFTWHQMGPRPEIASRLRSSSISPPPSPNRPKARFLEPTSSPSSVMNAPFTSYRHP